MIHDVFISYSSKDRNTALAVCEGIESAGMKCWIAPRDVVPGQSYQGCIVRGIRSCQVMVLILSHGSNESEHVLREVTIASEHGSPIIPFRIEDVQVGDDLYYYISSLHWLDALDPQADDHVHRLVDTVRGLVKPTPQGQGDSTVAPSDGGLDGQPRARDIAEVAEVAEPLGPERPEEDAGAEKTEVSERELGPSSASRPPVALPEDQPPEGEARDSDVNEQGATSLMGEWKGSIVHKALPWLIAAAIMAIAIWFLAPGG